MFRAIALRLFVLVGIFGLAACNAYQSGYDSRPSNTAPASAPPVQQYQSSYRRPATPPKHRRTRTATRKSLETQESEESQEPQEPATPSDVLAPTTAVSAPPATKHTLTETDDTDTRQSLEKTSIRLTRLNKERLGPNQSMIYDQVNGFVTAGRQALQKGDYVAASGYARKASALAVQLSP
jgi:hypothetical protein